MNDLNGKCVNVVLAVEMGRGMGFLQYPVKLVANFNGRPLESDLVDPSDSPVFNTELVWETEKKELRKVRSTNIPIRAELQMIDNNQKKDRIGFVLLSPRCASIIPYESKIEIPFKWQKLLGIAHEYKSLHPELFLSFTIRDLATTQRETYTTTDLTAEDQAEVIVEEPFTKDGRIVPIQYLPNGFIQIGNNCDEKFILSIIIQVAYNLDLLLPETMTFTQNREKYFISFKIFGITIKSKPFCRDLHANIPMNEKIVIRILSKYEILQKYLAQYCQIQVCFFCGRERLGLTKLQVDTLLNSMTEEDFFEKQCTTTVEQKCYFRFPIPNGIVPTGVGSRQPYVEVDTCLARTDVDVPVVRLTSDVSVAEVKIPRIEIMSSPRMLPITEREVARTIAEETCKDTSEMESTERTTVTAFSSSSTSSIIENTKGKLSKEASPQASPHSEAGTKGHGDEDEAAKEEKYEKQAVCAAGDQNEPNVLELTNVDVTATKTHKKVQSMQNLTARSEAVSESCRSENSVLKNVPPLSTAIFMKKLDEDVSKTATVYQQYCLDIVIENIILKKQIKSSKLCIKFKHPKASTANTITSDIYDQAGEYIVFENTRCKMFFVSTIDHIRKMVYAWPPKLTLLDESDQILTEELDIYTAMFLAKNRTECSYVTECKALRTYEPLAKISVIMYLQEYGLSSLPQPTQFDLLPPILDENVAIHELQELQDWKQIQKVQFSADLKIIEKQRIAAMKEEWAERKKKLEEKLNKSVNRCETLSHELQASINVIRTKKALEQKEEELSSSPNCTFQDIVDKNTQKYAECKKMELIVAISKLERDNENLNGIINDQRHEIQQIRKTALTKEQTANLLQQLRGLEEKFEDAQKAKTYFKVQWKRAVDEIHDLRSEDQKQMHEKIQREKIELSQLSLDSFIPKDSITPSFSYSQDPFTVASDSSFGAFKWKHANFPNNTYDIGGNT